MAGELQYSKTTGLWEPTAYPVKETYKDTDVPDIIKKHHTHLTSTIETKYAKEFLKVCAYYNKLFPSLKNYDWSRSSYNTVPFNLQYQERTDTGMGLSSNYLKAAGDLVVSRIGNIKFDYKLKAEQPTVQYTIYKDELERMFKAFIRSNGLARLSLESFHDAMILSFAHAFIDPWIGKIRKVSDWELGFYEAEFNESKLKRVMVRDFAFPTSSLDPYIQGFDADWIEEIRRSPYVDMRLYLDCVERQKYVSIKSRIGPATPYPFDDVLLATYSWDLGVRRTTVASLFDSLYPLQRQMDKLLAKKTQLLNQYKGPVPVFSGDGNDLIVKQFNNSAGECLFLGNSTRDVSRLITTLVPTPLDPELNAEMEAIKGQIFELAGVQQISMDVENYRSAAELIALDQMRDAGFQSQLSALAKYTEDIMDIAVRYMAQVECGCVDDKLMTPIVQSRMSWKEVEQLLNDAYIEITPIHKTEQTQGIGQLPEDIDYMLRHVEQFLMAVIKGHATYDNLDFSYDKMLVRQRAALRYVELKALGDSDMAYIRNLLVLLVELFIEDIGNGLVNLTMADDVGMIEEMPMEELPGDVITAEEM